jgi:hypothetical protein
VEQQRFYLVVGVVADGNQPGANLVGQIGQKGVPCLTAGRFQRQAGLTGQGGHVAGFAGYKGICQAAAVWPQTGHRPPRGRKLWFRWAATNRSGPTICRSRWSSASESGPPETPTTHFSLL